MASRSSAYFHLLSSYFLASAAALVAWTCGPLSREDETRTTQRSQRTESSMELWEKNSSLRGFQSELVAKKDFCLLRK